MRQDLISFIWEQLPYRLPWIIACFLGIGLSLSNLRRFPKPALLVLISSITMFVLAIASIFVYYMLMRNDDGGGWLNLIHMSAIGVEAISVVLLYWAAFADRQQYYPPDFFETGGRDDALRRE